MVRSFPVGSQDTLCNIRHNLSMSSLSMSSSNTPSPKTDSTCTLAELKQVVEEFVSQRTWHKFHNAKNLSMALAVEAAELMEHYQWLTTEQTVAGEGYDLDQVTDELADITSYVLALANTLDIDLASAVANKMVKNRRKYPLS